MVIETQGHLSISVLAVWLFNESILTNHSGVDLNMVTLKRPHACYTAMQLIHFDKTLFSVTFEV